MKLTEEMLIITPSNVMQECGTCPFYQNGRHTCMLEGIKGDNNELSKQLSNKYSSGSLLCIDYTIQLKRGKNTVTKSTIAGLLTVVVLLIIVRYLSHISQNPPKFAANWEYWNNTIYVTSLVVIAAIFSTYNLIHDLIWKKKNH